MISGRSARSKSRRNARRNGLDFRLPFSLSAPAHAPRRRSRHVACFAYADQTAYAYGSGGQGSSLLPEAGRKWGFGKQTAFQSGGRRGRAAVAMQCDRRRRARVQRPGVRPGFFAECASRPTLIRRAVLPVLGKGIPPDPPARKDNLRFSTSRKRNPSLSLVDARRRCRRTRRAWSPQCDPCRRPGRRSPGPGPASSLSAGGATLFRRPGRRSCFPILTATAAAPATPCAVGALALRAYAPTRPRAGFPRLENRPWNLPIPGNPAPGGPCPENDRPGCPTISERGAALVFMPCPCALPAMPMHGACTRLAECPPDPGGGSADSPRRSRRSPIHTRPTARPGSFAERRGRYALSPEPVGGPCSAIPRETDAAPATPCAAPGAGAVAPARPGEDGKGISPDPSARKDNLRFSTSPDALRCRGTLLFPRWRSAIRTHAQDTVAVPAPTRLLR